jgi:hypothetical protein
MSTTYSNLILQKSIQAHTLVTIRPYELYTGWVLSSTYPGVWVVVVQQTPKLHNVKQIEAVKFTSATDPAEVQLVEKNSAAEVQAATGAWYWDITTSTLYIKTPAGENPNGSFVLGRFALTFSTGLPGVEFADVDGNPFFPYVMEVPNPQKSTQDPYFGLVPIGSGTVRLNARKGNLDALFRKYQWDNASVEVKYGGSNLPYAEYQAVFYGKVQDKEWDDLDLVMRCHDLNEDLNITVPKIKFESVAMTTVTTFYQGGVSYGASVSKAPSDISTQWSTQFPSGRVMPIAYGYLVGIVPTLLSGSDTEAIVQLTGHSNAKIRSVTWDGEINISGKGQKFDWYSDITNSKIYLVRRTSTESMQSSACIVSFLGKSGVGPYFLHNFADIVKDLVQQVAGLSTSFDTDILDRSRFLCNLYKPRLYISSEVSIRDVLSTIMRSTLSYFYITNMGKYCFDAWVPSIVGELHLQEVAGDFIEIKASTQSVRSYSSVSVDYGYFPTRSKQYRSVEIKRPESAAYCGRPNTFQVTPTYLADAPSAAVLGHRLGRISSQPSRVFTIRVPMKCMTTEVMARLELIRERLPSTTQSVHAEVIGVLRNLGTQEVELTLDDQQIIGSQGFMTLDSELLWSTSTEEEKEVTGYFTDDSGFSSATDPLSWGRSRYY